MVYNALLQRTGVVHVSNEHDLDNYRDDVGIDAGAVASWRSLIRSKRQTAILRPPLQAAIPISPALIRRSYNAAHRRQNNHHSQAFA